MKIMLAAGGTAGHINPALAIADLLKTKFPDAEFVFVGTPGGMENRLVGEAGYPIRHIDVSGLKRRMSAENLITLYKLLSSRATAKRILREQTPDLVIGTGGYVCYPILKTAASIGIPTALHESNALAGLTVRMLAPYVDTVMLNFGAAQEMLKKARRTVVTGNPVRKEFHRMTRAQARASLHLGRDALLLLSFGGSLGAGTINAAMEKAIPDLLKKHPNLRIVHATGKEHYAHFLENCKSYFKADRVLIKPYLSNISTLMLAADLLLSRSGAMTISEASFSGTPAILVPYPKATDDHQTKNARAVERCGGATVLSDASLTSKMLTDELDRLLRDTALREKMRKSMYAFSPRNAEELILSELSSLLDKESNP